MRTSHAYKRSRPQQQQLDSTPTQNTTAMSVSSTRTALLRMHSQLQSQPSSSSSSAVATTLPTSYDGGITPLDMSYHQQQPTIAPSATTVPKMTTRSVTSSASSLRSQPIVSPMRPVSTRTFYAALPMQTSTFSPANPHQSAQSVGPSFTSSSKNNTNAILPDKGLNATTNSPTKSNNNSSSSSFAYSSLPIEESLQCAICLSRLEDPRALPCQHVYCAGCLDKMVASHISRYTITCPECRRTYPFTQASLLPMSYIHRTLLELTPTNFDINARCGKCKKKCPLSLCSCCDYLLCLTCANVDRQKVFDDLDLCAKTCVYRLKRIHATGEQLTRTRNVCATTVRQIETMYENAERKLNDHKKMVLSRLYKYGDGLPNAFWSRLGMFVPSNDSSSSSSSSSCGSATAHAEDLLRRAQAALRRSNKEEEKLDDVLALLYNLQQTAETLERASSQIDTCDVQSLLKSSIDLSSDSNSAFATTRIHLTRLDHNDREDTLTLLPASFLPSTLPTTFVQQASSSSMQQQQQQSSSNYSSTRQRRRKHIPKRLIPEHPSEHSSLTTTTTTTTLAQQYSVEITGLAEQLKEESTAPPVAKRMKIEPSSVFSQNIFDTYLSVEQQGFLHGSGGNNNNTASSNDDPSPIQLFDFTAVNSDDEEATQHENNNNTNTQAAAEEEDDDEIVCLGSVPAPQSLASPPSPSLFNSPSPLSILEDEEDDD